MDVLEYQAKELFREMDMPVLPSQRIDRPKDLKGLTIPYPVVLKSQVYIGGRGRVGGVRFVENTIDAVAAAQTIFNLPIMGEYPSVLLAEAKYNADREFYLAVVLNRSICRPVLLGSQKGGIDVQTALEEMQHVVVDQEFSSFYARRLALKMGLQGTLIASVSAMLEKMYRLFSQKDLDLVEINPLGVTTTGEVMALDGKIIVNDDALARHPTLAALLAKSNGNQPEYVQRSPVTMETDGQIGLLCNGTGLTMATLDAVVQAGGKPAIFLNIGSETQWDASPVALRKQLEQGLEQMLQLKQVRVLLINLVSGLLPCDDVAAVIAETLLNRVRKPRSLNELSPESIIAHTVRFPQVVVRLVGRDRDRARSRLEAVQIPLIESLNEAITQAVTLAKATARHL